MEDLMEEIVGEIEEEHDYDEPEIKKIQDNVYSTRGSVQYLKRRMSNEILQLSM